MNSNQDEVSLLCLIKDFHSKSITQTWSSNNGVITTGIQKYAAVQGNDKKYTMSSVLKVSASDWNANTVYHCKAGYKSNEMVERQIKIPKALAPIVTTLVPSAEFVYNQTTTVLGCMISGFAPDSIQVSWKKGQVDQTGFVLPSRPGTDATFETVTYLTVPVAEWKKGDEYACEVSHTPSSFNKRISMRYQEVYRTRNELRDIRRDCDPWEMSTKEKM
ncbi:pancreatic IgW, short secretory form-like [Cetorhinus maximus]